MSRFSALATGLIIATTLGLLDIVGIAGLLADPAPPAAVPVTGAVLGAPLALVTWMLLWVGIGLTLLRPRDRHEGK